MIVPFGHESCDRGFVIKMETESTAKMKSVQRESRLFIRFVVEYNLHSREV